MRKMKIRIILLGLFISQGLFAQLTLSGSVTSNYNGADISCNGASDGEATAFASGGAVPYAYLWGPAAGNQTGNIATGLSAGVYTVTATDNVGATATASVTLTEPSAVTATITSATNAYCFGTATGDATVTGSGGTAGYSFMWDAAANNQSTPTATALAAGNYCVSVTDVNGCQASTCVNITQPTAVSALIVSQNNVSTPGGNDGSITASASGGATPYVWDWGSGYTANPTVTGLTAGVYCVTVTDVAGCTATNCTTVTEPPTVTATISSQTNVSCNGGADGSITASATGGTPAYTWDWGSGYTTNPIVTGLSAGVYCVTVQDATGSTATTCVTITQPPALVVTPSLNSPNTCFGSCDASISGSVSGGVFPYTYNWDNGGFPVCQAIGCSAICAGTYNLVVTDANGCVANTSLTVTQPAAVTATITNQSNVSCNGAADGSLTAAGSGGTGALFYNWSQGSITPAISGLLPGVYCVSITDANGCSDAVCATITEPSAVTVTITNQTNVSCNGGIDGSLTAVGSGGTGTYVYLWNMGQNSSVAIGLPAGGPYCVTATDINGCISNSYCATITEPNLILTDNTYLVAPDSTLSFCVLPAAATTVNVIQNPVFGSLTPNGTGCYTYTPSALPEVSDTIIIVACDGLQSIQNTIVIGTAGCVWAGDTDTNQVVNNFDLLPIGIHYGAIGNPRPNADLNWDCEPMWNWFALPSGQPDPKHSDSNGDGIVNDDDTLAISLNWGQVYLRSGGTSTHTTGIPLYIDTATTSPGDTISLPIILGTGSFTANNAYGLAFTITYDNSIVDTNSIIMDYSNSWLGTEGVDMITIEKDFYSQGEIQIGMTRIDHTTRSGSGPIAHIQLTIKDDVLKEMNRRLDFDIKDVRLIDSVGNIIPVSPEASSVLILTTGVERVKNEPALDFQLFPNPSFGQFSIALSDAQGMVEVSIYNALGQLLRQEQQSAQSLIAVDFEATPGIYFVQLRNDSGVVGVKKLTIR